MLHLDTFRLVQYEKRQGQIRQEKQKFLQKRVRICIQCHTIPIILHVYIYIYMHSICAYEFTNIQLYEITYWTSGSGLNCEVAIILIQYGNLRDWKIVVLLPRWPLSRVLLCINMLKRVYVLVLCIYTYVLYCFMLKYMLQLYCMHIHGFTCCFVLVERGKPEACCKGRTPTSRIRGGIGERMERDVSNPNPPQSSGQYVDSRPAEHLLPTAGEDS